MQKIARTWSMMSACWQILKQDKGLLLFPLISGVCCLLLLASFALPLYFTNHWQPPGRDAEAMRQVAYYGVLFLFYLLNYFIVVFFNAAIVAPRRPGSRSLLVGLLFRLQSVSFSG
jgi:hypothetical protein